MLKHKELDTLVATLAMCLNAREQWQRAENAYYVVEQTERLEKQYDEFLGMLDDVLKGTPKPEGKTP